MKVLEIPIERIFSQERQREDYGDLDSLKFSIEQYGLLQPIIVEIRPDNKYMLLAGGRRLACFKLLGRATITAVTRDELDDLTRKELEYEENIQRKNLTWIEECKAISDIHKIKRQQFSNNFPERFGRVWSQKDTAQALKISEGKVSQDCQLAEALEKYPELARTSTRKDALRMLRHISDVCVPDESMLVKRIRDCFVHEDFPKCMSKHQPNSVDCIIADLCGLRYDEALSSIYPALTYAGHGWIFIPFDGLADLTMALRAKNLPYCPKPYIWHSKTDNNYHLIVWFSRAQAEPPKTIPIHMSYARDKSNIHTMGKPYQLYYNIVVNSIARNHTVVEPIAYDATLARMALDHSRNVVSYCQDRVLHEQVLLNIKI